MGKRHAMLTMDETVKALTDGLPIGLQLIGRAHDDDALLNLAERFERK